jgi:hypothetical protein
MADIPLHEKMRAYVAAYPTLPTAPEMTRLADALDAAITKAYSEEGTIDDTKRMLGCWARARRFWCDTTGERLI